MRVRGLLGGTLILVLSIAFRVTAQPIGSEFQVNTHTVAVQYAAIARAAAMADNGDFVFVWGS